MDPLPHCFMRFSVPMNMEVTIMMCLGRTLLFEGLLQLFELMRGIATLFHIATLLDTLGLTGISLDLYMGSVVHPDRMRMQTRRTVQWVMPRWQGSHF